jgi:hypothetical protein
MCVDRGRHRYLRVTQSHKNRAQRSTAQHSAAQRSALGKPAYQQTPYLPQHREDFAHPNHQQHHERQLQNRKKTPSLVRYNDIHKEFKRSSKYAQKGLIHGGDEEDEKGRDSGYPRRGQELTEHHTPSAGNRTG